MLINIETFQAKLLAGTLKASSYIKQQHQLPSIMAKTDKTKNKQKSYKTFTMHPYF